MKLAIFGKTPESKRDLKTEIEKAGFAYDEKTPDTVISYGGDGTFLWSERAYPGVPKALFRFSQICNKCHNLPISHALALLKEGAYRVHDVTKLAAGPLLAVNDIVVRNEKPTHALRYSIRINGKLEPYEYIGDGIVVSTPWGSSGYFASITRKTFPSGIGLAFNNTTEYHLPKILSKGSTITLTIIRGTAMVCADNDPHILRLNEGQAITIKNSRKKSRIITFGKT